MPEYQPKPKKRVNKSVNKKMEMFCVVYLTIWSYRSY